MFSEKTSKILMLIGIILFVCGIVLFLWKDFGFDGAQKINSQKFSDFGSFVGGLIGTLWAFAGVILFYVALREQREDIHINRDTLNTQVKALEQQIVEFELQRKELELTREVFIEQNNTLKLQQFESTYFNTLHLFTNLVQNITYREPIGVHLFQPRVYKGSECFEAYYGSLQRRYRTKYEDYIKNELHIELNDAIQLEISIDKLNEFSKNAYFSFFENYQSDLGHYFRTLYNLIRFVDEKFIDNPRYYTNLIRAQLSTYEHLMLFYNGISQYGEKKFKPLIEKYSLLNNMPQDLLIDKKHSEFYIDSAYK